MSHRRVALRGAALIAALAIPALLATGCGSGAKTPSVASLGTTPSSGGSASRSRLFPPAIGSVGASMSTQVGTGVSGIRYTACMQSHGVPNFPEPNADGTITITVSASLNPNSPLFQRAEDDCQHLVPAGKGPSQALQERMKARMLGFAACMRSHGVPDYPDPTFGAGGMVSQIISRSDGISPNSPAFQAAQKNCGGKLGGHQATGGTAIDD